MELLQVAKHQLMVELQQWLWQVTDNKWVIGQDCTQMNGTQHPVVTRFTSLETTHVCSRLRG